jgi:hypothetical protein
MEGWKDGRVEGWKGGRVEGWKGGRVEGWKGGRMGGGRWEVGGWEWEDPPRPKTATDEGSPNPEPKTPFSSIVAQRTPRSE